ncbi:AAA family ATPase [Streptomyces flaveolus]|uniref:AAA family ATPase n=1 Tax=Streptomyces flaveolus TaxID=67297 RepID=UPI0033BA9025
MHPGPMFPGPDTGDDVPRIVGRDAELTRIRRFLAASEDRDAPVALLIAGDAGSGKSTLLDAAARGAAARGRRVLRCAGHEGEQELIFAGLHQLLQPLLPHVRELPGPQRDALLGAFGLTGAAQSRADDRLMVNLAVLTLLSEAAYRQPVLVVVDDLQWLDACSLDAISFLARRIAGEPVTVLAGTRGGFVGEPFGPECVRMDVPPLSDVDAERLLDAQPHPPRGSLRAQILLQSAGNPLALVELTRATAGSRPPSLVGAPDPLPLTARLEGVFAERMAGLPPSTRRALLFAAAADAPGMPAARLAALADPWRAGTAQPCAGEHDPGAGPAADDAVAAARTGVPDVWGAAEEAGLVRVTDGRVAFRHPLMRSAVYRTATFAARREVHLALAEALADDPDRRAWHMAAATLVPDESIARTLADTADRARRRGGYRVAATALERAAELSPDARRRARRLLEASELAVRAGDPYWVKRLTAGAVAATDDPALLTEAALRTGWALAATARQKAALSHLLPLARSLVGTDPMAALDAIGHAAAVIHDTGDETYRGEVLDLLARLPADVGDESTQAWARACCDPFGDRRAQVELLERVAEAPGPGPDRLTALGATAWILDRTASAVRLLSAARDQMHRVTVTGSHAVLGHTLALAQFESGDWDGASMSAEDTRRVAGEHGLDMAGRTAGYVGAAVLVLRGDARRARDLIDRVVVGAQPAVSRALDVRVRTVRAAVAAVEGNHPLEYELLRGLFTAGPDPRPTHYHLSYYGIGDLVAAAVRVGKADEAAPVLEAVERRLAGRMTPRLALLVSRARALLAPGRAAEEYFRAATADPAGEQWPFERALLLLDFGEWLRRRRRTGEARTELSRALAVFERLGARPRAARATAELQACGVSVRGEQTAGQGVGQLTAQQLQIARLAATGLTNRQIGERLLLSARTVGFHLYQVFPKLGVSTRAQLRDALDRLENP